LPWLEFRRVLFRSENSTGNVLRAIAAGQGPAGRPVIPGDAAPAHQDPPVARPAAGPVAAPRVLELKSREYVSRLERSRRPNRAKVLYRASPAGLTPVP